VCFIAVFSLLVKGIEKLLLGKSLHCYQHGFLIAWCQAGETARLHECVVSFSIPIDYLVSIHPTSIFCFVFYLNVSLLAI
jgi:hypothetical protein